MQNLVVPGWARDRSEEMQPLIEETVAESNPEARLDASCETSVENSDSYSDASTDVGDDDDIVDLCEDDSATPSVEVSHMLQSDTPCSRPCFRKVTRQQRFEQIRRIAEEFCNLEFESVDASCQEALVLRMMTILKSLNEKTTFDGECGRAEVKRLCLLGLDQRDEDSIKDTIYHAEKLWVTRKFHASYEVLKQIAPKLRCKLSLTSKKRATPEEIEAMKLRRLQKRQRQRQERRDQRNAERAQRAKRPDERYIQRPRQSSSASTS
jgi:hypothetical protein